MCVDEYDFDAVVNHNRNTNHSHKPSTINLPSVCDTLNRIGLI